MNVFDEMVDEAPVNIQALDKIEEVSADLFIKDIVPNISSVEIMPDNSHKNNFMIIFPILR